MWGWLLSTAWAQVPPDLDARLLGPAAPAADPATTGIDLATWWPLLLAALIAAAVAVGRARLTRALAPQASELRMITRMSVGGVASVVLIEAKDGSGRARRLLLGTGSGNPTLVADLSTEDNVEIPLDPLAAPSPPPRSEAPSAPTPAQLERTLQFPPPSHGVRRNVEGEEIPAHYMPRRNVEGEEIPPLHAVRRHEDPEPAPELRPLRKIPYPVEAMRRPPPDDIPAGTRADRTRSARSLIEEVLNARNGPNGPSGGKK